MVRNKKKMFLGAFTVATMLLAACGAGNSSNNTTGSSDGTGAGSTSATSVAQSTDTTGATDSGTDVSGTSVTTGTEESSASGTSSSSEITGTSEVTSTGEMTSTGEAISTTSEVTSTGEMTSTGEAISTTSEVTSTSGAEITSTGEAVSTTTSGSTSASGDTGGTATSTGTPEVMTSTNGAIIADLFAAFAQVLTNNAGVTNTSTSGTSGNAELYTVFVPSGQAFDQMSALLAGMDTSGGSSTNAGLMNQSALAQVVAYHVVRGRYTAADLANETELTTLSDLTLTVRSEGGVIYINNARVLQSDIESAGGASTSTVGNQGAIHLIDSILVPPSASGLPNGSDSSSSMTQTITSTNTITNGTETGTATETATP